MKNLFPFLVVVFLFISCGGDDDICTGGEGTPRMKVKFKDTNNKLTTLDSLYVDVDYGNGLKNVISRARADSVFIPLRVDDAAYTEIQVRTRREDKAAKVRISYTTTSQYVSPACGLKKLYENVEATLETPDPVVNVEQTQKQILDENKTHLYLIF